MNAPEVKTETIEFARDELVGALMHLCVTQLESLKTPWHLTSERNQEIKLNKMREVINTEVIKAVQTIATERMPAIAVKIGKVSFEDKTVKTTLDLSRFAEGRHELADATGNTATLVLASPERFLGGAEKVKSSPDQPKLNLNENGDGGSAGTGTDAAGGTGTAATGNDASPGTTDDEANQPEIRQFEDGFMIYQNDMPIAGARKFSTHDQAETHLQQHLGITKYTSKFKREYPAGNETDPPPATDAPPPEYENMKAKDLRELLKKHPLGTGKGVSVGVSRSELIQRLRDLDEAAKAAKPAGDPKPAGWPFPQGANTGDAQQTDAGAGPAADSDGDDDAATGGGSAGTTEPDLEQMKQRFFDIGKEEGAKDGGDWDAAWTRAVVDLPAAWVEENYDELSSRITDGWQEGAGE